LRRDKKTITVETRKTKKTRTKAGRLAGIAAGLAALAVVAGIVLLGYNYLFIREINFSGNRHLTNGELLSLVGCSQKSRLFSVSAGDIYRRLKTSPWIKDVMVRKDLTGKVTVQITEAIAIAVLQTDERPYLVDREGLRLEEIREEPVYFLPVIKIDPASSMDSYHEAIVLAGILYDGKVMAHGGNIELSGSRPEEITMKVDNVPVRIGAGDLVKKLEKLNFVRDELVRRNMAVEYIDLRFIDKIVVKPLKQELKGTEHKTPKAAEKSNKKTKQRIAKKNGARKVTGGRSGSHVG
jgi:cell division protein FtsQ